MEMDKIPEAYLRKQLRGLSTSTPPTLLRAFCRLFHRLFHLSLLSCFLTPSLGFLCCLSHAFLFLIIGDFDVAPAISHLVGGLLCIELIRWSCRNSLGGVWLNYQSINSKSVIGIRSKALPLNPQKSRRRYFYRARMSGSGIGNLAALYNLGSRIMLIRYFAKGTAVKATQQWCICSKFQTFRQPPCTFQDTPDTRVWMAASTQHRSADYACLSMVTRE